MLVKIENNQPITYSVGQLRKANPNTSFPKNISEATLNSYGVFTVQELPRPDYDPMTHRLVQQQVSGSGSTWSRGWDVVALSQEELDVKKAQLVKQYENAVQQLLDTEAQSKGYDGILSACTYATSSVSKFAAEGQACVDWRDAVWNTCYATLAEVEAGTVAQPSVEELIHALPTITWPN